MILSNNEISYLIDAGLSDAKKELKQEEQKILNQLKETTNIKKLKELNKSLKTIRTQIKLLKNI